MRLHAASTWQNRATLNAHESTTATATIRMRLAVLERHDGRFPPTNRNACAADGQSITKKCNAFGGKGPRVAHDHGCSTVGECLATPSFVVIGGIFSPATATGAAAWIRTLLPPWGGFGITACRNPYFTT